MEVTDINKQKFLAELGKLLTFMYEEDRLTALAMYNKMFDDAEDEQALMQLLVSPTRQAVVIARAYDARERKLQVESQMRGDTDDGEETPGFVLAINKLYDRIAVKQAEETSAAMADQFSLFEDDRHPIDDDEYVDFPLDGPAEPTPEAEEVPVEEALTVDVEESPVEEPPTEPVEEKVAEEALAPDPVERVMGGMALAEQLAPTQTVEIPDVDYVPELTRKPKVALLILYILIAVPVTLIGLALLLIPTLLFFGLAVSVIAAGAATLVAAFGGGLTPLANILIVLGTAMIVLALGLLFLWLFIWFIGGAMVGLVRSVINLGRNWCYEEVPV